MTAKALPSIATKIPSKLDWNFNASTGSSIAQLNPVTRLVRSGRDGKFLYRAEYWGDYSRDFPIGSNALTASKALEDLKKDVAKLKRGRPTPSERHHATKKSPAQLQREIDQALAGSGSSSPFEEAKAELALIENEMAAAGAVMRTFPSGAMGLPPESVRLSPEYRAAKARTDKAFARLRAFNAVYVKKFAKELRAERAKRYGSR